jgi:hypothetical protein
MAAFVASTAALTHAGFMFGEVATIRLVMKEVIHGNGPLVQELRRGGSKDPSPLP